MTHRFCGRGKLLIASPALGNFKSCFRRIYYELKGDNLFLYAALAINGCHFINFYNNGDGEFNYQLKYV